jgi:hypothetical protein
MKIASKILMIVLLLLGLSLPLTYRAYAMAQISLQNNTKLWLNLYIDGNFGCGPVMPSGFCTSSVKPGPHLLEARKGDEVISAESGVNIGDGTSPTWTVTIEDPNQDLIKKIDGARYVNQSESPMMIVEDELVIRGTTLVWRNRVTWASPDIAEAMASGTRGFRHRTVGTWLEFSRMQIVGREAHHHRVLSNGSVEEYIFTISEDGNSITKKGGSNTYMFYRQ